MSRIALFAAVVVALAGCSKPVDERYLGHGIGSIQQVPWADVETDFSRVAQPGELTFVELTGAHCGGCQKNAKIFKQLLTVRHDVAVRIVPFPDELCPEHADDDQRRNCAAVLDAVKRDGMCFTPTIWAFAPDGTLLARDDTCAGNRPASDLFHAFADREIARRL